MCKTDKNKVYHIGIPTKTTKTTKSLVVVLRFCSKLRGGKNEVSCDATNALLAHCLRGHNAHRAGLLLHGTGDASVEKEKTGKTPEAECREKPLPPLLAQIGGKGLFNPQKGNFLNEPHHTGIRKVKQVQRYDNIKTNANGS